MKMLPNGSGPSLWSALAGLVRSWWEVDRIRVSSHVGRLLRIHPPSLISIDERMIEVASRVVSQTPCGPRVSYFCRTPHGSAELRVTPPIGAVTASITWVEAGLERILAEDEVQVWG